MENQTQYNKLIGRIENTYYYLEYIFETSSIFETFPNFKGAVGLGFIPLTLEEVESRRDNWDEDNYLWKCAVENNNTTLGAEEWHEYILNTDGNDAIFNLSYYDVGMELTQKLSRCGLQYELSECVSSGRCFDKDMKWDKLFNPELWKKIQEAES